MYQNPFAIKPGEILTPQQLFDRFVDWTIFNQKFVSSPAQSCSKTLMNHFICCSDHLLFKSESDVFHRYFEFLGLLSIGSLRSFANSLQNTRLDPSHLGPFTYRTLGTVIRHFNLNVNREKYKKMWGENSQSAFIWID